MSELNISHIPSYLENFASEKGLFIQDFKCNIERDSEDTCDYDFYLKLIQLNRYGQIIPKTHIEYKDKANTVMTYNETVMYITGKIFSIIDSFYTDLNSFGGKYLDG